MANGNEKLLDSSCEISSIDVDQVLNMHLVKDIKMGAKPE